MRLRAAVFAGILILSLCAGCGQETDAVLVQEESAAQSQEADAVQSQEVVEAQEKEENAAPDQEENLTSEQEADVEQEQTSGGSLDEKKKEQLKEKKLEIPENGRRLTEEELAEYTEWIQDISNYGFLLSDWADPAQIELYQVFYNGAGVAREGTDGEKQAYCDRYHQPEIYTDFLSMDKADVDAVLLEKVGLTYDELMAQGSRGMEEDYFAETNSFCLERGDTNYVQYECKDGVVNEDGTLVTLDCGGSYAKLSVTEGHRRFLSNHITDDWYRNWEGFVEHHEEEDWMPDD